MNAPTDILQSPIVESLGWTLLHFTWQAAAVALLTAAILWTLRKSSANIRYIIACSALALLVLLPAATFHMSTAQTHDQATIAPTPHVIQPQIERSAPLTPASQMPAETTPQASTPPNIPLKLRATAILQPTLPLIVCLWLLGVITLSLRNLTGWMGVNRLRHKSLTTLGHDCHERLAQLCTTLKVTRPVKLVRSTLVAVPTVIGWLKPVILLPASALTGLDTSQLQAILAHELAHIRRCDYLVNIIQTVIETLGFHHPAVWWISATIRRERENCCDDIALSVCGDRLQYARALASLEEMRQPHARLAVAASGSNLFARIRRIVTKDASRKSRPAWAPTAAIIILTTALVLPGALALAEHVKKKSAHPIETMLLEGFRANRAKFQCGKLTWTQTTEDEGLIRKTNPMQYGGSYQLFWDGKKIATRFEHEQVYSGDPNNDGQDIYWLETVRGTRTYDGGLLSRRPKFGYWENFFGVIQWTGVFPMDKDIEQLKTLEHVEMKWEIIGAGPDKQIKLSTRNLKDGASAVRCFDLAKGCNEVLREWYNGQGRIYYRQTAKLAQVKPGLWLPVEIDQRGFDTKGELTLTRNYIALDLKKCSFNDKSAIPQDVFDSTLPKDQARLDAMLGELTHTATDANLPTETQLAARRVAEDFLAAAMAGNDDRAIRHIDPNSAIADQLADLREVATGQNVKVSTVYADDKIAEAITTALQEDREGNGALIIYLNNIDGTWLIDDIDFDSIEGTEKRLKGFLQRNPDAVEVPAPVDRPQ